MRVIESASPPTSRNSSMPITGTWNRFSFYFMRVHVFERLTWSSPYVSDYAKWMTLRQQATFIDFVNIRFLTPKSIFRAMSVIISSFVLELLAILTLIRGSSVNVPVSFSFDELIKSWPNALILASRIDGFKSQ